MTNESTFQHHGGLRQTEHRLTNVIALISRFCECVTCPVIQYLDIIGVSQCHQPMNNNSFRSFMTLFSMHKRSNGLLTWYSDIFEKKGNVNYMYTYMVITRFRRLTGVWTHLSVLSSMRNQSITVLDST